MNYDGKEFTPYSSIRNMISRSQLHRWIVNEKVRIKFDPTSKDYPEGTSLSVITETRMNSLGWWINVRDLINCIYRSRKIKMRVARILRISFYSPISTFERLLAEYFYKRRTAIQERRSLGETPNIVEKFPMLIDESEMTLLGFKSSTPIYSIYRYLKKYSTRFCEECDYVYIDVPNSNCGFSAIQRSKKILRMTECAYDRLDIIRNKHKKQNKT